MILPTDCVYFCQEANKQSVVIPGHWWVLQATSSFVGPKPGKNPISPTRGCEWKRHKYVGEYHHLAQGEVKRGCLSNSWTC